MQIVDNDKVIGKGSRNKLEVLATERFDSWMTYQGVQEDVETGSRIHLWKLHYSIELEGSDFQACVSVLLTVDVRKLLVEVMPFL
jgi:hypothetical protein